MLWNEGSSDYAGAAQKNCKKGYSVKTFQV